MCQIAKLMVSTGGGIALQGVYRSTNITDDLRIGGTFLQQQDFLVERLEQLLCALEKEVAKFVRPFIREESHWLCLDPLISSAVILVNHSKFVSKAKQALCMSYEQIAFRI